MRSPPGFVYDPLPGCSLSRHLFICAHKSSVYAQICPPPCDLQPEAGGGRWPVEQFSWFSQYSSVVSG